MERFSVWSIISCLLNLLQAGGRFDAYRLILDSLQNWKGSAFYPSKHWISFCSKCATHLQLEKISFLRQTVELFSQLLWSLFSSLTLTVVNTISFHFIGVDMQGTYNHPSFSTRVNTTYPLLKLADPFLVV